MRRFFSVLLFSFVFYGFAPLAPLSLDVIVRCLSVVRGRAQKDFPVELVEDPFLRTPGLTTARRVPYHGVINLRHNLGGVMDKFFITVLLLRAIIFSCLMVFHIGTMGTHSLTKFGYPIIVLSNLISGG